MVAWEETTLLIFAFAHKLKVTPVAALPLF